MLWLGAVQVPPLKVFVMNSEAQQYCRNSLVLGNGTAPASTSGDWYQFKVGPGSGYIHQGGACQLPFRPVGIQAQLAVGVALKTGSGGRHKQRHWRSEPDTAVGWAAGHLWGIRGHG